MQGDILKYGDEQAEILTKKLVKSVLAIVRRERPASYNMRFQLPQFIETETKLVGPLTLKQFLWMAGGAAILFLLFMTTQGGFIFFVVGIPVALLFLTLAFLKIEGMPLINYAAFLLSYFLNPKRYIFKKGVNDFKNKI